MAKKPKNDDAETKGVKLSKEQFELAWIFGALAILAVVFVIFYVLFSGAGKVHYNGLTFTKEQFGDIPVYHYSYISEAKRHKPVRELHGVISGFLLAGRKPLHPERQMAIPGKHFPHSVKYLNLSTFRVYLNCIYAPSNNLIHSNLFNFNGSSRGYIRMRIKPM